MNTLPHIKAQSLPQITGSKLLSWLFLVIWSQIAKLYRLDGWRIVAKLLKTQINWMFRLYWSCYISKISNCITKATKHDESFKVIWKSLSIIKHIRFPRFPISVFRFLSSVAFHIETRQYTCLANHMTGVCMKCNIGLKWANLQYVAMALLGRETCATKLKSLTIRNKNLKRAIWNLNPLFIDLFLAHVFVWFSRYYLTNFFNKIS